jgi:hypothetical protein
MGRIQRSSIVFALPLFILLALWCTPAQAVLNATESVAASQIGPNSYEYNITLHNSGDTNISSLWFGWVPFYDLLPSPPTSISSPSGWTGINAPDLFGTASAQFTTTTNPLTPGQTLSGFKFDSPDSPAIIGGTSFFAGYPVTEAYIYNGPPVESGSGGVGISGPVQTPEPGSLALLLFAPVASLLRRGRRG